MLIKTSNLEAVRTQTVTHRVTVARSEVSYSRRSRLSPPDIAPEEVLVVDERHGQSPARAVEQRLTQLLKGASMPASMLQVKAMLKDR
jgi:hypothetical protein